MTNAVSDASRPDWVGKPRSKRRMIISFGLAAALALVALFLFPFDRTLSNLLRLSKFETWSLLLLHATQSGKVFRLRDKGVPVLQGYGRGDQLLVIRVETPVNLNKRQKELLEEFARISGEEVHPMKKSFFEKVIDILS